MNTSRMAIESKCNMPQQPDDTGVTIVELSPKSALDDYLQAMRLANEKAEALMGDNMLLAWYDKRVKAETEIAIAALLKG